MIITTPLKRSIDSTRLLFGATDVEFALLDLVTPMLDIIEFDFSLIKYFSIDIEAEKV
jgi:hypothetical protein